MSEERARSRRDCESIDMPFLWSPRDRRVLVSQDAPGTRINPLCRRLRKSESHAGKHRALATCSWLPRVAVGAAQSIDQ